MPLLSICIATYNRADFIGTTLRCIIEQLTEEVELVVVDGASSDATQGIVERIAADCPALRYVRLPKKGGVDQDFCKAVDLARGEYCWLFPDDDLLKPGAVRRVLDELRKGPSLVIVNAEVMDRELSNLLLPSLLENKEDESYGAADLEGLFTRVVPYISFIGCVVIRRQVWLERERAHYFGTEFVHVGVIFQRSLPGRALVLARPDISIRYGNAQWTSRAFEIWMIAWPRLIWSFERISAEAKRKRVLAEPWRKLKTIRYYRALGAYSRDTYARIIAPSSASVSWKLAAWCIAILPWSLANQGELWYLKTFKKHRRMAIYDLSLRSGTNRP